jgi:hypothetical protein
LVDLQLDAQNSYLFIYTIFIKILYMFRALPCSSSGGPHRNCVHKCASKKTTACGERTEKKVDYRKCHSYTSRQRQDIDSKEYSKKKYIPSI